MLVGKGLCGAVRYAVEGPFRYAGEGQVFHVKMGTLVDDSGIRPMLHIFVGSKAPWHEITDSLPQFAELSPRRPNRSSVVLRLYGICIDGKEERGDSSRPQSG